MELSVITSNSFKYEEIRERMAEYPIELKHISMKYPEIQADTMKQVLLASLTNLLPLVTGDFLIEDAGLEINELNGFPGPYSAYVYTTIGWQGILRLMDGLKNRKARFISVIGLFYHGEIHVFEGISEGKISTEGLGSHGFGFDPIFIPTNFDKTFAQLDMSIKNSVSHRGKSTKKLLELLINTSSVT